MPTKAEGRASTPRRHNFIWVTATKRSIPKYWTVGENARAQLRVVVKHILRKYGYPPDKQEKATQTVL